MFDSLEADAVVNPGAVMVKLEHALLAYAAVVTPVRFHHVASPAKGKRCVSLGAWLALSRASWPRRSGEHVEMHLHNHAQGERKR